MFTWLQQNVLKIQIRVVDIQSFPPTQNISHCTLILDNQRLTPDRYHRGLLDKQREGGQVVLYVTSSVQWALDSWDSSLGFNTDSNLVLVFCFSLAVVWYRVYWDLGVVGAVLGVLSYFSKLN